MLISRERLYKLPKLPAIKARTICAASHILNDFAWRRLGSSIKSIQRPKNGRAAYVQRSFAHPSASPFNKLISHNCVPPTSSNRALKVDKGGSAQMDLIERMKSSPRLGCRRLIGLRRPITVNHYKSPVEQTATFHIRPGQQCHSFLLGPNLTSQLDPFPCCSRPPPP